MQKTPALSLSHVLVTPSYENDDSQFGISVLLSGGKVSFLLIILEEMLPAVHANHSIYLIYLD